MPLIAISGGGTGGHIYPAISIAKELIALDSTNEIVFIGGANRLESTIVPRHGFRFLSIPAAGFPRKLTLKWLPVISQVCAGIARSMYLLRALKPGVVVGTGGYVCGPVLFAALLLGIPTIVQEQNAYPGLTNRILGRWAKSVCLAFETAVTYFPARVARVTGNPIRRTIGTIKRNNLTYERFGLDANLKTVFVMGGSQGAHAINNIVTDALGNLAVFNQQLQIIHQTGEKDYQKVTDTYKNSPLRHLIQPYFDSIESVYSIVDLMICRAGGMTISEITACGIPAIFIPLPTAAGNHQKLNAQAVEDRGGGLLLNEQTTTGNDIADRVIKIISDSAKLHRMATAARKLGNPKAGEEIAASIYSLVIPSKV